MHTAMQDPATIQQKESSLLTTYWSKSTSSFHRERLNCLFQVALYLPS